MRVTVLLPGGLVCGSGYRPGTGGSRAGSGCQTRDMGAPRYDPFSEETLADPFPAYAELRARCPVQPTEFTPPFFTLSRYADVREALADPSVWSIRYGQSPQYTRPAGLVNDPPEH